MTIPETVKEITIRDCAKVYRRISKTPIKQNQSNRNGEFFAIFHDFTQFLFEQLLLGHTVQLPYRCGWMKIQATSIIDHIDIYERELVERGSCKGLVDWQKTRANKKAGIANPVVYHEHDKIGYNVIWGNLNSRIKNIRFYRFRLSKVARKILTEVVNEGQTYDMTDIVYNKRIKESVVNDWF